MQLNLVFSRFIFSFYSQSVYTNGTLMQIDVLVDDKCLIGLFVLIGGFPDACLCNKLGNRHNVILFSGTCYCHGQVKEDNGLFFLPLDFQQFRKVCDIEEFYVALEENPKDTLLCMGAAMHKVT